jgi:hypothetical protein
MDMDNTYLSMQEYNETSASESASRITRRNCTIAAMKRPLGEYLQRDGEEDLNSSEKEDEPTVVGTPCICVK